MKKLSERIPNGIDFHELEDGIIALEKEVDEQADDIRKIKVIMNSDLMKSDIMDMMFEYSFYDKELTKINWAREVKSDDH